MYHKFCILIGRIVVLAGKILKRGSSLPGIIALKLDSHILSAFTLPKTVIAVTGSSGKGSISSMIAKILEEQGYTVAHNKAGSNLTSGILTLLLNYSNYKGIMKTDVLLYEIDERYAKEIFTSITPQYVIISNISRDQPPRQRHFDFVYEEIQKAITPSMHLILNGDDPYLQKFILSHENTVTYYSISKNKYSYQTNKFMNLNISYCPNCHHKLKYHYYNFENIGSYYCESCHFQNPNSTYMATRITYHHPTIEINDKFTITLSSNLLYHIYNTLAAFTLAGVLSLDLKQTAKTLSTIKQNTKIFDTIEYNHRLVTILNNKNENSSTFNQSLLYISHQKEQKTIVIGWKEISRRYHYNDLSWLYDIDFELLQKNNIDKILCIGENRFDIATRLKYAGIKEKSIKTFSTLEESRIYLKNKTRGNIYAVLNFDYVTPFHRIIKEGEQ